MFGCKQYICLDRNTTVSFWITYSVFLFKWLGLCECKMKIVSIVHFLWECQKCSNDFTYYFSYLWNSIEIFYRLTVVRLVEKQRNNKRLSIWVWLLLNGTYKCCWEKIISISVFSSIIEAIITIQIHIIVNSTQVIWWYNYLK